MEEDGLSERMEGGKERLFMMKIVLSCFDGIRCFRLLVAG